MKVIRCIIKILLISILYDFIIFNKSIEQVKEIVLVVYDELNNCVMSLESEPSFIVFDYDCVNRLIEEKLNDYQYTIRKINSSYFIVEIEVKSVYFYKKKNEKFYIEKGEANEKFI